MRARKTTVAVTLAAGLAFAPGTAADDGGGVMAALVDFFVGPQQKAEFRWSGKLSAGQTLEVKGINGGIRVEPGDSPAVGIEALRKGRRNDPNEVKIVVLEHAGGITVCSVYPAADGRANECAAGDGGRLSSKNNDVSVEYRIRVPRSAALKLTTVNGGIDAIGFAGDVSAETVNGGIDLATEGAARAETVNGGIDAKMGVRFGDTRFETVNGGIELTLPAAAAAELDASCVNGSISSDFAVSGGSKTRRSLRGTIGGGGPKLHLETVNGSISVVRR
jgi:hypothetical protein